jgi:hypothetical protein
MSASRRGAQGESVKSKKSCTQKYAKWNPVPKNMQSCTPEKCLPILKPQNIKPITYNP